MNSAVVRSGKVLNLISLEKNRFLPATYDGVRAIFVTSERSLRIPQTIFEVSRGETSAKAEGEPVDRLEIPFSPPYSIEVSSVAPLRAVKIAFVLFEERFLFGSHLRSPQSLIHDPSFDSDFFSALQNRAQ